MRTTVIVTALLILGSCIVSGISVPPPINQTYPWEWIEDSDGNFVVFYRDGDLENATRMLDFCGNCKTWVDHPIYPYDYSVLPGAPYDPALDDPDQSPAGFPKPGKVLVYLYDNNTWYEKMGRDEGTCFTDSDKGIMYFMSPTNVSKYQSSWIDYVWYQKNVVHEYVHIPTWRDLLVHQSYASNVPYWLTEGTAEYISVFKTTAEIKDKYTTGSYGYTERMEEALIGGPLVFSASVDSYPFITYVMKYVYEKYGNTMVSDLFKNNDGKEKFWDAVETYLHVPPFAFEYFWNKWAMSEFGHELLGKLRDADIDGNSEINIIDVSSVAIYFAWSVPKPDP